MASVWRGVDDETAHRIPTVKASELAAEYGITKFAADLIKFTIASDLVPGPQIDDAEIDVRVQNCTVGLR